MPAFPCGELHIPCLTRVPASVTTATGMKRTSAMFQRKNCHHWLSLFLGLLWRWWPGDSHWTCGLGSLLGPWREVPFLCQHPQAQSWGHFLFNSSGKVGTRWLWTVPPAKARIPRERDCLCNKTLVLLVGKIFPQSTLAWALENFT